MNLPALTPNDHRVAANLARTIDQVGIKLFGQLIELLGLPNDFAITGEKGEYTASMKLAVYLILLRKVHYAAMQHKPAVERWDHLTSIDTDGETVGTNAECGEAFDAMQETEAALLELIGYGEK